MVAQGDGVAEHVQRKPVLGRALDSEVRRRRAGGDDQMIEWKLTVIEFEGAAHPVDTRDFRLTERHVRLPLEDAAHGVGHVGGVQPCGRDLIEQRLERVVVVPVDDRDAFAGLGQLLRRRQPTEASTHDDYL